MVSRSSAVYLSASSRSHWKTACGAGRRRAPIEPNRSHRIQAVRSRLSRSLRSRTPTTSVGGRSALGPELERFDVLRQRRHLLRRQVSLERGHLALPVGNDVSDGRHRGLQTLDVGAPCTLTSRSMTAQTMQLVDAGCCLGTVRTGRVPRKTTACCRYDRQPRTQ
jgi:hypothetical protein